MHVHREHGDTLMASLTIRNIDDEVKARLRLRAARHGRSMEEEARVILKRATGEADGASLWTLSRRLFGDDGVDLSFPNRADDRMAPDFAPVEAKDN